MVLAPLTTWSLVTMMPSSEKMTPLPAPLWTYWPNQELRLTISVLISTTEGEARAAISLTERAPPVYPAGTPEGLVCSVPPSPRVSPSFSLPPTAW